MKPRDSNFHGVYGDQLCVSYQPQITVSSICGYNMSAWTTSLGTPFSGTDTWTWTEAVGSGSISITETTETYTYTETPMREYPSGAPTQVPYPVESFGDSAIAVTTVPMLLLVHQASDSAAGTGPVGLSQGARIGVAVGAAVVGLLILVAVGLFIRRARRRRLSQPQKNAEPEGYVPVQTGMGMQYAPKPPSELDPYAISQMATIESHRRYSGVPGQHLAVPFTAGASDVRHELDGQGSEPGSYMPSPNSTAPLPYSTTASPSSATASPHSSAVSPHYPNQ